MRGLFIVFSSIAHGLRGASLIVSYRISLNAARVKYDILSGILPTEKCLTLRIPKHAAPSSKTSRRIFHKRYPFTSNMAVHAA